MRKPAAFPGPQMFQVDQEGVNPPICDLTLQRETFRLNSKNSEERQEAGSTQVLH